MASISTYCHDHKHGLAQMYNFGAELCAFIAFDFHLQYTQFSGKAHEDSDDTACIDAYVSKLTLVAKLQVLQ